MCLCFVVDGSLDAPRAVLLGHKKRGHGTGNIVGPGGHIDSGETPAGAAAREVAEESGLRVDEQDLHHHADVVFTFPARPSWDQTAAVFVTDRWHGEPRSTDEITPEWFALDGERLRIDIVFADDRPHDDPDRLHASALAWANDTATDVTIEVIRSHGG